MIHSSSIIATMSQSYVMETNKGEAITGELLQRSAASKTNSDAIPMNDCSLVLAKTYTLTHWIVEINKVWQRGASSTLDLARVVSAAKIGLRQH